MTQVHDDDLDNVCTTGGSTPVPDLEDEDVLARPASTIPEDWDRDGPEAPAPATDQEPLFEQLRSAYLHRDDTNDWANDSDTGGWAADDSGRWEAGVATAYEDDDSRYEWVDAPATWESEPEGSWDDEPRTSTTWTTTRRTSSTPSRWPLGPVAGGGPRRGGRGCGGPARC